MVERKGITNLSEVMQRTHQLVDLLMEVNPWGLTRPQMIAGFCVTELMDFDRQLIAKTGSHLHQYRDEIDYRVGKIKETESYGKFLEGSFK